MPLSKNIVSQFVKATQNDTKTNNKETTVFGTVTKYDAGSKTCYVRFDGSSIETPITRFTSLVSENERVTVMVKNHTAVITGNLGSPSAGETHVISTVDQTLEEKLQEVSEDFIDSLWS